MPEDGLKPCNAEALADAARSMELAIPVARLARIAGQLAADEGTVEGHVAFAREAGRIIATVGFVATLQLRCQRCLGALTQQLQGSSRVALVESESAAADVPPELETTLAPGGRIAPAELVEEELLLALPAAPRHAEGQCPAARQEVRASEASTVQRPFAHLGELLADRSKH